MEYKIKTNYTKDMIIDFKRFTLNKKSFLKPAILYLLCIAVIVCSFIYNRKFELNFTTVILRQLQLSVVLSSQWFTM